MARADTARLMEIVNVVYAVGLASASLWNAVLAKPIKPAYVGVFAVIAVACAIVLVIDRPAAAARPNS